VARETFWASQKQIAQLFGAKVSAINKYIKNIISENELDSLTISILEIVQTEGKREVKSSQSIRKEAFKHIAYFQKEIIGIVFYGGDTVLSFGDSKQPRYALLLRLFF